MKKIITVIKLIYIYIYIFKRYVSVCFDRAEDGAQWICQLAGVSLCYANQTWLPLAPPRPWSSTAAGSRATGWKHALVDSINIVLGSLANVSGCFCRSKHFLCELPIFYTCVLVNVFVGVCACVGLLCMRVFVHESGHLLVWGRI